MVRIPVSFERPVETTADAPALNRTRRVIQTQWNAPAVAPDMTITCPAGLHLMLKSLTVSVLAGAAANMNIEFNYNNGNIYLFEDEVAVTGSAAFIYAPGLDTAMVGLVASAPRYTRPFGIDEMYPGDTLTITANVTLIAGIGTMVLRYEEVNV